jgi:hypothetical protein
MPDLGRPALSVSLCRLRKHFGDLNGNHFDAGVRTTTELSLSVPPAGFAEIRTGSCDVSPDTAPTAHYLRIANQYQ